MTSLRSCDSLVSHETIRLSFEVYLASKKTCNAGYLLALMHVGILWSIRFEPYGNNS